MAHRFGSARISHHGGADILVCPQNVGNHGRQECLPYRTARISHRTRYCRLAAALLLPAMLAAGAVQAQDYVSDGRELAKTWAMHQIAVIQAAAGDVQGAKRTVSQISDDGGKGPSDVTAVWFCQGQPIYDHPPAPAGCAGYNHRAVPAFFGVDRVTNPVPSQVPPGLPANYLDSDPRHGAVVEFADERDSHGTRVTSRTYADGYAVIETPSSVGNSR